MDNTKLPKESESQEIGHFAIITFNSCCPLSWRPTPTDGDADAGLDMQVQIVEQGHYTNMFNAQIKGSAQNKDGKNKKLSATGDYFAQALDIRTLNYYARIENPVLLVFVDLTKNQDPRNCPAYYLWIDEEIDRLLEGKPNLDYLDKESHTFYIPIENVLNPDLNVVPYLNNRLEKKMVLEGLYNTIEKKYPDPLDKVNQIGTVLRDKKIALDTILNETETPWLDAPKGTFAFELKSVSEILFVNNVRSAQEKLDKLSAQLKEASSHERSEYYFQKARLSTLIGKREEAHNFFREAHLTSKDIKKYHIAFLESRIPLEKESNETIIKIIEEIQSQDDIDYLRLKSKLFTLIGNTQKAFEILEGQEEKDVFIIKALIHFLSSAYEECISQINKASSEQELTLRQELSLKILKARSYFNLGSTKISENRTIPFSGTPDMDPVILKMAWIEAISALDIASQLGYPHDVEIIIDVFSILGMYFSEQNIVKKHLIKLAEIRPSVQNIQDILLTIAMHLDDRETAAKQLSILPITIENIVNKIILAYRNNDKSEVVKLTIEVLGDINHKKPPNYDIIVAIAAECANDLMMNEEREKFLTALNTFPNSAALIAVYNFIVNMNQNILAKPQAVEKLYDVYNKGHKDFHILSHLFHNLNPYEYDSAQKIIIISNDIISDRDLLEDEYLILCRAKTTTLDWGGVLNTSHVAQNRFSHNPRFKVFEALALDEIGETWKSIELLEEVSIGEKHDPLALEIYIKISARSGLIEKAKTLVKRLFEKTIDKKQKIHLLRTMFNIELIINPKSEGLIDICLKYGQLCDQDDETEEGIYLLHFLAATFDPNKVVQEEYVKDFQERLERYRERFPQSKVLRSVKIDENTPRDLLSQLEKITGFTEEKKKWYQRNENLLKNSQFPFPYLIRHKLLLNVNDLLHLWELSKIAGRDYPQYCLTINDASYKISNLDICVGRIPLIDEIALIVLFDLGLLEYIFKIFPKIIIMKESIINLQYISQQFYSTNYSIKAKNILLILSKYVMQINQPSSSLKTEHDNILKEIDIIKSYYESSKYILYTDDLISRIYICRDDHINNTISTIDIIEALRDRQIITMRQAADKYATLCAFNVIGTRINYKDILIVLADDLQERKKIDNYLKILSNHDKFNFFVKALWEFKGSYPKALKEIGDFVSYMLSGKDGVRVEQNIITALWYYWYQKIQFTIISEKDKLHFLSRSLLYICISLLKVTDYDKKNKESWSKLWSIYNDIVEYTYAEFMSRDIEERSIFLFAQMISEFEINNEINLFYEISSRLISDTAGLIDNTSNSNLFQEAYRKSSIKLQLKKSESVF
jgi:hypothetical protein